MSICNFHGGISEKIIELKEFKKKKKIKKYKKKRLDKYI